MKELIYIIFYSIRKIKKRNLSLCTSISSSSWPGSHGQPRYDTLSPLLSPEVRATCQLYIVSRIIQGLDQLRLGVVVNRQVPKWRGSTTTTIDRITQVCTCNKVDKVYMFRVCVLYIYFGTSEMGGGIIKRIRCLMFNELN